MYKDKSFQDRQFTMFLLHLILDGEKFSFSKKLIFYVAPLGIQKVYENSIDSIISKFGS